MRRVFCMCVDDVVQIGGGALEWVQILFSVV